MFSRFTCLALGFLSILVLPFGRTAAGQAPDVVSDMVQAHFAAGKHALESGDLAKAIEEFRKVLASDPALYQARVNLGLAYHTQGDLPHAVEALSAARKATTELGGANLILGSDYLALGRTAEAIAPLKDAVAAGIGGPEAQTELCGAYVKVRQFAQASACAAHVYGSPPTTAAGWYQLGRQYLDAAHILTIAMRQKEPDGRWTKRLNGDVAAQSANWKLAVRFYEEAAAAAPAPPGFNAALGFALLHMSKVSEADEAFRRELAVQKLSVAGLSGVAEAALVRGDLSRAEAMFNAAAKSNPAWLASKTAEFAELLPMPEAELVLAAASDTTDPGSAFVRALALRKSGNSKEAAGLVDTVLKERRGTGNGGACDDGNDAACAAHGSNLRSAGALIRMGHFQRAASELETATNAAAGAALNEWSYWLTQSYLGLSNDCFNGLLEQFPGSALAYRLRAESEEIDDNLQGAIENYRHAVQIDGEDPATRAALASLLLGQNRVDEASKEGEAALKLQPDSAAVQLLAARIAFAAGRLPEAGQYARKALSLQPAFLPAHELLGRILFKQDDAAGAAAELKQALPLDDYGDLHYLLFRAYQKQGKSGLAQQALAESKRLRQAKLAYAQQQVAGGAPENK